VVTRLHSLRGSDICLRHFPGGIVSSRHHGRLELAKNVFDIYTIIFLVLTVFIFCACAAFWAGANVECRSHLHEESKIVPE
jgi:hypothetical protein